jgi:uncharacterized membrane protein YdjX (TVP38/TMEM64 family)
VQPREPESHVEVVRPVSRGRTSWRSRAILLVALLIASLWAWSSWGHDALHAFKDDASPLWFFAAMAVLPALGVPMTPFFLLAGATFGARFGLLGSLAALGVNLSLCYWLARTRLRHLLAPLLRRMFRDDMPSFATRPRAAWRLTWMVKVAPGLPAFAKNYFLGMAGVPFRIYLGISMLVTGSYAAFLIMLGDSLFEHDIMRTVLALAVVIVLALGFIWWRRGT